KKTIPNRAANIRKPAALPAENARVRNSRTGSIGSAARSSQATNAAVSTAPAVSDPITSGLDQPTVLARISPHTRPSAPPIAGASPAGSKLAWRWPPALASILPSTSGISARPIGMFSQKIHCQDSPWATAPPITGPASTASPITLLKIPSAQAPPLGRERRAQQRQRQRQHQRRAGALHRAGRDQRAGSRRERTCRRRGGEQPQADRQHPPPPQPLTQRCAG